MAIFDQENKNKFPAINFFSILAHQTLDPDPESRSAVRKNAGSGSVSGSALNQCGSETLHKVSDGNGNKYILCCRLLWPVWRAVTIMFSLPLSRNGPN
jgi:hypothetical protein